LNIAQITILANDALIALASRKAGSYNRQNVIMRKLLFLALLSITALAHAQQDSLDFKNLNSFIDSAFQKGLADGLLPGAVIGVTYQGKLLHGKAYGLSNIEEGEKVNFDKTIFQLGSVGKLFTALAVLKEVERGRLDLHSNVNDYLTEFKVQSFDDAPITLHHLLTHTAGLNDRVIGYASQSTELESLEAHLARRMPLPFTQSGQEVSYSNYGFGLAGYLVEISSGKRFQDYVQTEILDQLQMHQTTYAAPSGAQDFARGYELKDQFNRVDYLARLVVPAGSIAATGTDLVKFINAILNKDERLLSNESFDLLFKEHFTPHPLLDGHGYGMEVQNFNGWKGIGKGGNIPGYLAYVMFFPEQQLGLFTAVNTETDNFLESFTEALKNRLHPEETSELQPVIPINDLSRFAGDYRINRYNRNTLEDVFHLISGTSSIWNVRDSVLAVYHNAKMNYYQPISDLEFQNTVDPELFMVFEEEKGRVYKMHRNVNIGGFQVPATLEKLKWYGTVEFINEYAGLFPIFNLTYLLFPLFWLIGLFKAKKNGVKRNRFTNSTRLITLAFSALVLLSMYAFSLLLKTGEALLFGVPKTATILLNINYLLPLLLLVLLYKSVHVWRKKEGHFASRIYLSVFAAAGLVYTVILHQWHLIGANI